MIPSRSIGGRTTASRVDLRWLAAGFAVSLALHLFFLAWGHRPGAEGAGKPPPPFSARLLPFPSPPAMVRESGKPSSAAPRIATPGKAGAAPDPPPPSREGLPVADAAVMDAGSVGRIAREVGRQGGGNPAREAVRSPAATAETVLGRAMDKAYRPDCRQRYADSGLLALPLLLRDAAAGSGCQW